MAMSQRRNRYPMRYSADIAKAARREYDRAYRAAHREQIRDTQKRYWYRKGLAMQAAISGSAGDEDNAGSET